MLMRRGHFNKEYVQFIYLNKSASYIRDIRLAGCTKLASVKVPTIRIFSDTIVASRHIYAAPTYDEYLKELKDPSMSKFDNEKQYNKAMGIEEGDKKKKEDERGRGKGDEPSKVNAPKQLDDKGKEKIEKGISKDVVDDVKKQLKSKPTTEEIKKEFIQLGWDGGKLTPNEIESSDDFNVIFEDGQKKPYSKLTGEERQLFNEAMQDGRYVHQGFEEDWSKEPVDPTKIDPFTNIQFSDGTTKQYKDLNDWERNQVHKEVSDGTAESRGFIEKEWNEDKISISDMTDDTNIIMPNGERKLYKDLTDNEKDSVHKSLEEGTAKHRNVEHKKTEDEEFEEKQKSLDTKLNKVNKKIKKIEEKNKKKENYDKSNKDYYNKLKKLEEFGEELEEEDKKFISDYESKSKGESKKKEEPKKEEPKKEEKDKKKKEEADAKDKKDKEEKAKAEKDKKKKEFNDKKTKVLDDFKKYDGKNSQFKSLMKEHGDFFNEDEKKYLNDINESERANKGGMKPFAMNQKIKEYIGNKEKEFNKDDNSKVEKRPPINLLEKTPKKEEKKVKGEPKKEDDSTVKIKKPSKIQPTVEDKKDITDTGALKIQKPKPTTKSDKAKAEGKKVDMSDAIDEAYPKDVSDETVKIQKPSTQKKKETKDKPAITMKRPVTDKKEEAKSETKEKPKTEQKDKREKIDKAKEKLESDRKYYNNKENPGPLDKEWREQLEKDPVGFYEDRNKTLRSVIKTNTKKLENLQKGGETAKKQLDSIKKYYENNGWTDHFDYKSIVKDPVKYFKKEIAEDNKKVEERRTIIDGLKENAVNEQYDEYKKEHPDSGMTLSEFTKNYENNKDKAASVVVRRGNKPKVRKRRGSKLDVNGNVKGDK